MYKRTIAALAAAAGLVLSGATAADAAPRARTILPHVETWAECGNVGVSVWGNNRPGTVTLIIDGVRVDRQRLATTYAYNFLAIDEDARRFRLVVRTGGKTIVKNGRVAPCTW